MAPLLRGQLKAAAKRIIVKIGSAVITNERGELSTRMDAIVPQIVRLREQSRQVLLVTSGSVALGRKSIHPKTNQKDSSRNAAAIGQSRLMSYYMNSFQLYGCDVAQVLLTKDHFHDVAKRESLRERILGLFRSEVIPIVNTNDFLEDLVMSNIKNGELDLKPGDMQDIILEDNDSLAAILAHELESDLLIILSNVDGVYSGSPENGNSKLLSTFTPAFVDTVEFGSKSNVGLGGMQAKVRSALWTLKKGTSVVICNGSSSAVISRVVDGERVGTFFTEEKGESGPSELANLAREGSQKLKSVGADVRSKIIAEIAQALKDHKSEILANNEIDIKKAEGHGLEDVLIARLKLTDNKLESLSLGLKQIADKSKGLVGKVLKEVKISDSLHLRQVTAPIGVLMVIFESRPDCLPQISSLSIATGNGLLLKGGKEAYHSNRCLYGIIRQVLAKYDCQDAIQLIDTRELVSGLVGLESHIDLIIPRGSNQLVRSIQEQARSTPVLGHAEGICHVYIDKDANKEDAIGIAVDSKCNYPAACNAMETLLIHRNLVSSDFFSKLCDELRSKQVKINMGSRLAKLLPVQEATSNYKVEYGSLECTLEVVESLNDAVDHINKFGSHHTDAIVTTNEQSADKFRKNVDSASVFVNCSTRFADGFRYGLGAEVGISTSKIHARGPAGMESLLIYKWLVTGKGDRLEDYEGSGSTKSYIHEEIIP